MHRFPTPARPSTSALRSALVGLTLALLSLGCLSSQGVGPNAAVPLETVSYVDLERFAGTWYVIENIGLSAEEGAHDEVETYTLRDDGRIDIAFTFRAGSFDGPEESIPQLGWVHDEETNAEWRVRPFWPLSLAYLIIDLDDEYGWTVIGHPSKRWVWIMARAPRLDPNVLAGIRGRLSDVGYDVARLVRVPQRPLDQRPPGK
ncbi:MAG: lipocalin family protein [Myxococcota bacterium]